MEKKEPSMDAGSVEEQVKDVEKDGKTEVTLNPAKFLHSFSFAQLFLSRGRTDKTADVVKRHETLANAAFVPPPSRPISSRPVSSRPASSRPVSRAKSAQYMTHGPVIQERVVEAKDLDRDPNWLPGLPKPPPGVYIEPPRNRSRSARTRYLSQLQSYQRR